MILSNASVVLIYRAGFKRILRQRDNRGPGRGNRLESAAATSAATTSGSSNSDFNQQVVCVGSEPSVHGLSYMRREPAGGSSSSSNDVGLPVPSEFTVTDSGVPKYGVYQRKRPASVQGGHGVYVSPEVGGTRLKIAPSLL